MGPRAIQQIHGACGHDQGLRGIQTARDADDHIVDPRRFEPFGQTLHLDIVGLVAALIAFGRIGRYVGEARIFPVEEDAFSVGSTGKDTLRKAVSLSRCVRAFRPKVVMRILSWARLSRSISAQITWGCLLETFRFCQETAVFIYQGVTVPGQVGGGFSGAGGGVEISCQAARGLGCRQLWRYSAFPMVILEAERLPITVAPARAA